MGKPWRILVVDDEQSIRETTVSFIERAGYTAIAVKDGPRAFVAIEEFRPHLILLDIRLPGGPTGVEICRRIRALPAGADFQIVMMTGYADAETVHSAVSAGATDYIAKPFRLETLLAKVSTLLKRLPPDEVPLAAAPASEPASAARPSKKLRGTGLVAARRKRSDAEVA